MDISPHGTLAGAMLSTSRDTRSSALVRLLEPIRYSPKGHTSQEKGSITFLASGSGPKALPPHNSFLSLKPTLWPISSFSRFTSLSLSQTSLNPTPPRRVFRAAFPSLQPPRLTPQDPHTGPCTVQSVAQPPPRLLPPGELPWQPPCGRVPTGSVAALPSTRQPLVLGQGAVSRAVTSPLPEADFQVLSL